MDEIVWFFEDEASSAKSGNRPASRMHDLRRFMQSRYAPRIVSGFVRLPNAMQKSLTLLVSQVAGTE